MKKTKNHQDPKFKFMKPLIHMLYDSRCIICQNKGIENHVHHIDGDSSNNEVLNLTILCNYHHKLVHKNNFQLSKILSNENSLFAMEIATYIETLNFKTT